MQMSNIFLFTRPLPSIIKTKKMNYKTKLNHIDTFIFDVDGVLTDGKVYFLKEIMRALNAKDGIHAVCIKMGYHIFIITGGYSEDLKRRLLELGIKEVHLRLVIN